MIQDKNLEFIIKYFEEEITNLQILNDEISDMIKNDKIEIDEINKKISMLAENMDYSENIFLVQNENKDFESVEIKKLENIKNEKVKALEEKENQLNQTEEKLNKLSKILNRSKKIQVQNEKYNVDECITKAEFCKSLILVDQNRCKMEMNNLIDMLNNVR